MVKINAPFTVRDIESAVLQGREYERERIIALLEQYLDCEFTDYDYLGFRDHSPYCKACELVALIKGEN